MPEDRTVADAPCTACGCLCDDIVVAVRDGRIIEAANACPIGRAWFLDDAHTRPDRPAARIEGEDATVDEAIDRAAEILLAARSPLVLGLAGASLEAQAQAVAIADRIGAAIDPGRSADSWPRWKAIQRVGMVSATLGEVRDRADVVVFWGVDPATTHPRHLERYSAHPRGRFVPEGRLGRTIVVVDAAPTATSAVADRFFVVPPDGQGAALATLRAILKGVEIDGPMRDLAALLKSSRYGAFFFGPGLGISANVEEALKLMRDLNASARFVALTMGAPGNASGAEAVLSWQGGSPIAVDFAGGYPRFRPDDASAEHRLSRGEADAALIVMDEPQRFLSASALAHLARIPTVVVAPDAHARGAAVAMSCGTPGIHSGGTIMRSDGATLPLRPSLSSPLPDDRRWLSALLARLGEAAP